MRRGICDGSDRSEISDEIGEKRERHALRIINRHVKVDRYLEVLLNKKKKKKRFFLQFTYKFGG